MKLLHVALVLVGLLSSTSILSAQRVLFTNPHVRGVAGTRGLHLGYHKKNIHLSFGLHAGYRYGPGYSAFSYTGLPYHAAARRVTFFYYSSPPPPPLLVFPAVVNVNPPQPAPVINVLPPAQPPPVINILPPPQAPDNRVQPAKAPAAPAPAKALRKPEGKGKKEAEAKRPKTPPRLPMPPAPEDDPQAENARLIAVGRQAFLDQEYARAARQFRRATQVWPANPEAHFLLGQALLALGKYQQAVQALHEGLSRQPDWPTSGFRPLDLYGPHVGDFTDHLRLLEETLQRHANDPVLLFLYAYQLWFDGRRDEAALWFQKALPGAADVNAIDRFLQALPPAGVL